MKKILIFLIIISLTMSVSPAQHDVYANNDLAPVGITESSDAFLIAALGGIPQNPRDVVKRHLEKLLKEDKLNDRIQGVSLIEEIWRPAFWVKKAQDMKFTSIKRHGNEFIDVLEEGRIIVNKLGRVNKLSPELVVRICLAWLSPEKPLTTPLEIITFQLDRLELISDYIDQGKFFQPAYWMSIVNNAQKYGYLGYEVEAGAKDIRETLSVALHQLGWLRVEGQHGGAEITNKQFINIMRAYLPTGETVKTPLDVIKMHIEQIRKAGIVHAGILAAKIVGLAIDRFTLKPYDSAYWSHVARIFNFSPKQVSEIIELLRQNNKAIRDIVIKMTHDRAYFPKADTVIAALEKIGIKGTTTGVSEISQEVVRAKNSSL